jgi:hypothetical protein
MLARIGLLLAFASFLSVSHSAQNATAGFSNGVCTESPEVSDRPPDDPNASSFASPGATWYANDSRTLWAWWWGKTPSGDYKVLWVRPPGTLSVTGKRLDGSSAPLSAHIPGGYDNTFQASGLSFPTAGCWQVDANASGQSLRFVVQIR